MKTFWWSTLIALWFAVLTSAHQIDVLQREVDALKARLECSGK